MPTPIALLAALTLAAAPAKPPAQPATSRAQVPDRYKWKLADLFPDDAAWARARADLASRLPGFDRHRGHLGDSARALADALSEMGALQNALERVYVYASARADEDTREPGPRAMRAEAERLAVEAQAALSWVRPAVLDLPPETVKRFLGEDPRLREWAFFLDDTLRWKPHTLPAGEERIVAKTGDLDGAGRDVHSVLLNADLPFPTVKLSTGAVRLDQAGYERSRTSPVAADREKVFHAYFGALKQYERTIGTALYAQVKAHLFERDVRRFDSSLAAALFRDNVPTAVYERLVADVNANLPTLHRYLKLRQRMLGLQRLRYEDLYVPLVKAVDRRYDVDQAVALTLDAVKPLGDAYVAKLRGGFQSGWTDFLPVTGKRAGAYSTGVYGVHPYQLLNFNGQWTDVSTLAHEAGHSMHTVLAFEKQPYATSNYATFVAEVASTLNENLLFRRAIGQAKDDGERLALLGNRLESLRTTLFRQTMFAEFELAIHQLAEKGEALTGEKMSALYLGLVRRYYGHDAGVCQVADLYGAEWTYIQHFFHYDFYVYQYATSLVASTAIARAIREDEAQGRTGARDRYLAMLAAGGSRYPVDLLREAGVDMTTPAPFAAAMEEMNATMDEMERILKRTPGAAGRPAAPAQPAQPAQPTQPTKGR
ncbi:oligoendopeptidase F [Anaeromyxobacter sp. K]|uniref:oligoendopeptidase F n=1 Tax=Anaeromyxobacter sp. (strain K) TaxID=447217 RepID=UPI00015F892C|nr:oligoendopeptidase F [Anaeromyxobacter sp. K]ACG73052.1 oligoendopeptidase F [Anaeromyxobacter sp. K]